MHLIADLHIHSKYSRATSKDMVLEKMAEMAKIKGINVLATGDFTHPIWLNDLKNKLISAESGLYKLKENDNGVRFIVSGEISSIYTRGGKTRRVHNLIILSSLEAAEKINEQLIQKGCNLHSDGRPIIGLDSQKLLNIVMESDPSALFVPAHIWTPWFSVFGSKSGFDSLEEVFGEDVKYIHALETGLSSDPLMNWRLSALDKYALISNSDAHSPNNFGREANVFDIELSYENLINAIKSKDPSKFLYTIEFYPEEGMYHFDGHRACQVRFSPEETKEYKKICPVCGKLLTIGVLSRVGDLADRPLGSQPKETIPFKRLVPLKEIIAEVLGVKGKTKKVEALYNDLINNFENEFNILLNVDIKNISSFSGEKLAEALKRVREGQLVINPGYDGEYGEVKIFNQNETDSDTFSVN